jgi:NAD-dependent DNA ligase
MVDGKHLKYGKGRVVESSLSELIGLAHGLTADNKITQVEAEYLQKWLANRPVLADSPFLQGLYERVEDYLSDDYLDEEEASDLLSTLKGVTGGNFELGEAIKSSSLPLCNPRPVIAFEQKRFCFTGTFSFGNRKACEAASSKLGARCGSMTMKTDYLVVGIYATDSWLHSSAGHKILKAVDYRDRGVPISIISEPHWIEHLGTPS